MHGRVGSAFSNDRFTHRSRIVLFHDGSWCAVRYRSRLRAAVALDADGDRGRVVVRGPHHDRGMVAELIDGCPRLVDRLAAHASGVPPEQREVLHQQHAELVGRVVQRARGDVAVDPQHVEPGVDRELDVTTHLSRCGVGESDSRREQVGAFQEQPLAVDRAHPFVPGDLAQPGPASPAVAQLAVDDHLDRHLRQRLVAERTRPPQRAGSRCRGSS